MRTSPVINCGDLECLRARFAAAASIGASSVHIDVGDGAFAPVRMGGAPADLKGLLAESPGMKANVHLMVADPEGAIDEWFEAGAKRAIVHVEAVKDWKAITSAAARAGGEIFLGLKKETPAGALDGFLDEPGLQGVHFLAVPIGFSGGRFDSGVLEKIRYVKAKAPHLILSVDGGVDPETAAAAKAAGADEVVSATYIFGSPNPQKAYQELIAL
ncbi:hypothetical protein M1432_02010 [Patescibacteria group bacterium]|nr:hypothetical protein [Patescibacteria group bacterium]